MSIEMRVRRALMADADHVLVDSPPGAGKTYLAEGVVEGLIRDYEWRVVATMPTRAQGYNFARRFRARFPTTRIQVLHGRDEVVPDDIAMQMPAVSRFGDLVAGPGVVVSTIAKQVVNLDQAAGKFNLVVVDEAYQVAYKQGFPLDCLAPKRLMIGDPGQLSPFSEIDDRDFEIAVDHILWPLPKETLRVDAGMSVLAIERSRRLPPDTVRIIQPTFYPTLPFTAIATDVERRLAFAAAGIKRDRIDRALDAIATGASLVAIALPERGYDDEVDPEVSAEMVEVGRRLRARGVFQQDTGDLITANDIAYCDTHVASVAELRGHLGAGGIAYGFADTANSVQGRQAPVVISKHPLSSVTEAEAFSLDPGRLCVMVTRHLFGCIVVTRDNIGRVLDEYEHDCGARLASQEDVVWNGFRAHSHFWRMLEEEGRIFR